MRKNSALIMVLISAILLRLININQSFWMDESISAMVVKNYNLVEIITKFIRADTHPPLYYLLLDIWSLLFGYSEFSLRIPSLIFGVLTVYVIYKIGKIYSEKAGIYISILMAVAPLHIYYSQESRMYTMTAFLAVLAVYFYLKKKWLVWGFSLLFLGASDYLPLAILPVFWLHSYLNKDELKNAKMFLVGHLPLAAFLILWSPVLISQSNSTRMYLEKFPEWRSVLGSANLKDLLLVPVKFAIGRISFDNQSFYFLVASTILLLIS